MEMDQIDITKAEYNIGDVVYHNHHDFRGVIIDVDANFSGDDEWYEEEDGIKGPKNAPWYHVLVDEETTLAYVSEKNIQSDSSPTEIIHPMIDDVFTRTSAGKYMPRQIVN